MTEWEVGAAVRLYPWHAHCPIVMREKTVPNCAQNCAREGLESTPNHPTPANQIKKNPSVNPLLTEGFFIGKEARQASALPLSYVPTVPGGRPCYSVRRSVSSKLFTRSPASVMSSEVAQRAYEDLAP
jgi:hypothetical protein